MPRPVPRRRSAGHVLVIGVLAVVLAGCGSSGGGGPRATTSTSAPRTTTTALGGPPETIPFTPASTALLSNAPPPWPLPANPGPNIINAGLNAAPGETLKYHYHVHLDIVVDGRAVPVPAGIGFSFDQTGQVHGISSLHTHDATGVIHIESPTDRPYALGQFFAEWGVAIDTGRIGGLVSGPSGTLRVFVDGRPFTGNPAQLVLKAHQEIALWYGPSSQTPSVPSRYSFPEGD